MNKPNYYAIIPADVRYADNLTTGAKLLYGEVTALAEKEGYCWASNSYFARLYGADIRTITRWINDLRENGFITYDIIKPSGNLRQIYLCSPIDKNVYTYRQKCPDPIDKNVLHNNTSIVLNINKHKDCKNFDSFWELYPNKTNVSRKKSAEAFAKAIKKVAPAKIIKSLKEQIEDHNTAEGLGEWRPRWKHPTTWLNQECWDIEVEKPKPKLKPFESTYT